MNFQATVAHANIPVGNEANACSSSKGSVRVGQTILRGMMDSGAHPNMRRSAEGLSNRANVNIQVRVAKQGVGSVANISGRIVIDDRMNQGMVGDASGGMRTLVLPDFQHNLWSIYELARAGYTSVFDFDGVK